jgi:prepilin-type N-terminal cleavage/methylation domain-containing protein
MFMNASRRCKTRWNANGRRGSSLVEVLVVMVIFAIGILAVVQIFPGGFRVLSQTRNQSTAAQLARDEIERLKAKRSMLAEQIVPVRYRFVAGDVQIEPDADRRPNDLGSSGIQLRQDGELLDASANPLGNWQYLSFANLTRRVIGEGNLVPAPRQVGSLYGGLRLLQFGPIVYNNQYRGLFPVYGNDLFRRDGAPGSRVREWEFFLENSDQDDATLYVSRGQRNRAYRWTLVAYVQTASGVVQRDLIPPAIQVPGNVAGGFVSFLIRDLIALAPGETFLGCEFETVRLARLYERIATSSSFDPSEPFQFMLLDDSPTTSSSLGMLLFNPAGYNFQVPGPRGRRQSLQARVDYDVFDWRIIRDEFRVPAGYPGVHRLLLGSLKVAGSGTNADLTPYSGLNVPLPDESGNAQNRDFALVDSETGGVFLEVTGTGQRLLGVDKSVGAVTFFDFDNNAANGTTGRLMLPGATAPVSVQMDGRSVKALYRTNNDWSVQVMKAPAVYRQAFGARPGIAQFYVGGTDATLGGSTTRVYFPWADLGRKVILGEVWTQDSGGNLQGPSNISLPIQGSPADPIGLPYIDVSDAIPGAVAFDFRNGYAVRQVRGASVSVRVMWNPTTFTLVNDADANLQSLERFGRGWRKTTLETYLQRGEN